MEPYEKELAFVKKVLKENPKGMTVSDISKEIKINRNSVAKYLDVLLISGHVEMRTIGPAKVFSISHRVPLSAMLNFSSDYILVLDKDLKVVQVNDNLLDLAKVKRESLLGKGIEECPYSPLNNAKMISKIKDALEGKDFTMETGFKPARKEFYFKIKLIPTTFEDGEQGVTILAENITEQKKVENALKRSEERYRLLFDTSPVGIGIADLEGNVLASNRTMEEMTGYTEEELRKVKLKSTYVDLSERRRLLGVLRESGRVRDYEVRLKRKNGEVYIALLNIDVVELDGRKVLLTTSRDTTEQKRAEKTLRESENKFRTIFENVNDMIIYLDKRGKVLDINKKVEDILSYRRDEVIGKNFVKLGVFGAKGLPRIFKLFTDLLRGDRTVDMMELEIRDKKGNRVPIEANVKIVKRDGEKEGVVVIIRQIKGN